MITAPQEKESRSRFLSELVGNPEFKDTSIDELNNQLVEARIKEQKLLVTIEPLEKKSAGIYLSFPELKGGELKVSSHLFRGSSIRLRQRKLERAKNRIEKLAKKVEIPRTALIDCRDKIEEITSEMEYRALDIL